MKPSSIQTYGGPFEDEAPVMNPTTQQSAAQGNEVFRDVAQLTRTGFRAIVAFPTSAGAAGAIDPSSVVAWSMWGDATAVKPVVEKTATGLYKVTYAPSYPDELGNMEPVSFVFAMASHRADPATIKAPAPQVATLSANEATVAVFNSSFALDDHGGNYTVVLALR